jgi:pimeloyl-ACP methyl ester carboxylesterase
LRGNTVVAEKGSAFREGSVDADGFRIRYQEAGEGPPLVYLHGAGGLRLTLAHDLLRRAFRVIAFEMPGFDSAENQRTQTIQDLATTMAAAAEALGLSRFNLMGTSFGGTVAAWMAVQRKDLVAALVLDAPGAIRPEGSEPVAGSREEVASRLYVHPERVPVAPAVALALAAQRLALVRRLRGPDRDAMLEQGLRELGTPVLVLFGTQDVVIPPEMGRVYKELIANAHLMFVYDAGHALMVERPEAFAEVVADFLERTDAFVISRTKTVVFP